MGNKKSEDKSRRWFLSLFISGNDTASSAKETGKAEMVKMLTAEGKLVEVDKKIVEAANNKQKASNKQILSWMKNPSKENT